MSTQAKACSSSGMRIKEMKLHPIAIADPPLRSSYGRHAPFALRTMVELISTDGLTGISETYGGDGPLAGLEMARDIVTGADPFQLTRMFQKVTRRPRGEPGRSHPDLSGARRESARPGVTHLRGDRNRLPRPDRQSRRQAGLRRDRRTRPRRSHVFRLPLL